MVSPFVISYAGLSSKKGSATSACDTVPIENLFLCPESGDFFPVYDAFIRVESTSCKDPRSFFCPACGSRLRINAPPKYPVAECRNCAWVTDNNRFKSLPDLLLCEKNPFSAHGVAFDSLVKTIQSGTDREGQACTTRKSVESSSVPLKSRPSSHPHETDVQGIVDFKAPEPVVCGCVYGLDFDCCSSSAGETKASVCEASGVTPAFSGRIFMKDCLPPADRFSVRDWSRSSMPPRRGLGPSLFTSYSPFSSKHQQPSQSLRQEAVKASTILPLFSVSRNTVDPTRLVLLAQNCGRAPMHVDLELQHGYSSTGGSRECLAVSWIGAHAGHLSSEDGNREFVLRVDDTRFEHLEIVVRTRFSQSTSKTECDLAPEFPEWSNQTWDCRMVISQPRTIAGS